MASKQSEELKLLYQGWAATIGANPNMSLDEWRDLIEHWAEVTAEPGGVDYLETTADGVPAMWAVPKHCAEDRVLLSLHGGGYVTGSIYTHRKLFAHIAKSIGCRALLVEYRRAPEHVHPAQLDDVMTAYSWLLKQGIAPGHIAVVGDSAGGALALSMALRARDEGRPTPDAVMLLSPWVDLEISGETIASNAGKDVLFRKEGIERLVDMFLGPTGNRRDQYASPLYADLKNLPPLYIQVGGDELLLDDSRRLAERAKAAGVDVRLDVFPELQHTFHFSVGRAPEANDAVSRLAKWVRPKLDL